MQGSIAWRLVHDGEELRVALSGEITENSDFAALLPELSGEVVLDLAGVTRVNSCGVREWIHFVHALRERAPRLALERCSVPIVNQLNMIANFRGHGVIRSVFAPYFCAACGDERAILVLVPPGGGATIDEGAPCPTCGAPMEFDDLPERFLAFTAG